MADYDMGEEAEDMGEAEGEVEESAAHEEAEKPTLSKAEQKRLLEESDERFKLSSDYWSETRRLFADDIDFAVANNQWPDNIAKDRELEGRPCLTVNRMMQFIRQVTNDQRQNKPGIKVRPVDDKADYDTAEVMQGLIRHIEANSNADIAYDTACFYQVAAGFGFFRVTTDYPSDSFEQEIYIRPIPNPLSVFWDHNSRAPDGSDWEYCFVVEEITKKEFERKYPDRPAPFSTDDETWETEDTVRLAEYWYKKKAKRKLYLLDNGMTVTDEEYEEMEGQPRILKQREQEYDKVCWCLRGGNSILDHGEWAGKYIPIVPVFGDWCIVNNKVFISSLIRNAKDAQRMYNYFRSTETELMALQPKAPYVLAEGQVEGFEQMWANANNENYAYLPYKPVTLAGQPVPPPMRQPFATAPTGVLAATQNAEMDMMNTIGIQRAGLGMQSNEASGKAIMARQREGDTATYHFIDNLTRAIRLLGQILVDLTPKIYDTPRVVRVLGEDGSEMTKPINQPAMVVKEGKKIQAIYDLGLGSYDVVVTAGPNYTTKRQEAQDAMMQVLPTAPQLMQIAGDLIFKSMDWPGADEIAERLAKTLPPELRPLKEDEEAPQVPPEMQMQFEQMQQQIEQMGMALQQAQAEVQDKQGKMQLDMAKLQLDQFRAETERMKAERELAIKEAEAFNQNNDNDLTELEKEQFNADLQIRLKEMDQDHKIQMLLLETKLEEMKQGMMQPQVSQPMLIERDANGVAVAIGGRKVLRDAMGNPIGVE